MNFEYEKTALLQQIKDLEIRRQFLLDECVKLDGIKKSKEGYRVLTCVYCGQEYPQNIPSWNNEELTKHIKICKKHPLRKAEKMIEGLTYLAQSVCDNWTKWKQSMGEFDERIVERSIRKLQNKLDLIREEK